MARDYQVPTIPKFVLDLVDRLYKIRDYYELIQVRPSFDSAPTNVMLREQYDELQTIQVEWLTRAKTAIRNIRGARNDFPLWGIDEIKPPQPDPVDLYYSDPGTFFKTKNPNPRPEGEPPGWDPRASVPSSLFSTRSSSPLAPSTPLLMSAIPIIIRPPVPWPPWPPLPPLPPPPVYWRPPAEEAYSYTYAYYYMADRYVADMQLTTLDFQYWGYFIAEFLKNYYMVDSFWKTQQEVREFLLPYGPRLDAVLP